MFSFKKPSFKKMIDFQNLNPSRTILTGLLCLIVIIFVLAVAACELVENPVADNGIAVKNNFALKITFWKFKSCIF